MTYNTGEIAATPIAVTHKTILLKSKDKSKREEREEGKRWREEIKKGEGRGKI